MHRVLAPPYGMEALFAGAPCLVAVSRIALFAFSVACVMF